MARRRFLFPVSCSERETYSVCVGVCVLLSMYYMVAVPREYIDHTYSTSCHTHTHRRRLCARLGGQRQSKQETEQGGRTSKQHADYTTHMTSRAPARGTHTRIDTKQARKRKTSGLHRTRKQQQSYNKTKTSNGVQNRYTKTGWQDRFSVINSSLIKLIPMSLIDSHRPDHHRIYQYLFFPLSWHRY